MAGRRWRGFVLPLLIAALWAAAGWGGLLDRRLWATPDAVAATAVAEFADGDFWRGLGTSLARDLTGFAIGCLTGLVQGAAMASSPLVDRLIGPLFHGVKQIALFAWIPLMSIWLGSDEPAKIAFIALAAHFPVALNTYAGIRAVAPEHREVGRVLRLTGWQRLSRISLPAALPSIASGVQLGLVYSWLATIGAEYFFAVAPGIGNTLMDGRDHFQMALVMFGMVVVGLVGFGLNYFAGRVAASLLGWRGVSS
jgi:sulfonate transport system permease protein